MHIDINPIINKQRIYIGGTQGVDEIIELSKHVLQHIQKPADFYTVGKPYTPSQAPIVIINGGEELKNGAASFLELNIHILLIHKIKEKLPKGYDSLEAYVNQYEKLADALPKAGTSIFNADDNIATLIGKKEREDVKNVEYSKLPASKTAVGFDVTLADTKTSVVTKMEKFPKRMAAARALLNRIGVNDAQIISALKTLS